MLKHTDIRVGTYYHLTYDGNPDEWVIVKAESKDDDEGCRWTGPCINASDGTPEFEDGSEDNHGGYFGGDSDCGIKVVVRYATTDEIIWLNQCIEEGELVDKPTQKSNTMEITQLTQDMVGKKFTCSIEGREITDGRIQYANESYYLCQNKVCGSSCDDKLGYSKSWSVSDGKKSELDNNNVTNLVIVEELPTEVSITSAPQAISEQHLINGEIYSYQENYLFMQKAKRPGMAYASVISENITGFKDASRVTRLLLQYDLPTFVEFDSRKVFTVMKMDKKREKNELNYILLEKIGKGIVKSIPLNQLEKIINELQ